MDTSMSMDMASSTMSAMSSATPSASMSSMGGGDMGMGSGSGASCKISMLWNWYTIDSCFISSTWHVRSSGAFAGSCIGVILLVLSLEFLRRAQREFDRYLARRQSAPMISRGEPQDMGNGNGHHHTKLDSTSTVRSVGSYEYRAAKLKIWEQAARSLLYMLQFGVGYFVMLLAMYYNGYFIIMILIGAFLGALTFQWDTFNAFGIAEQREPCC